MNGYEWGRRREMPLLKTAFTPKATNLRLVRIENSGHFLQEEQPEVVGRLLLEFFN